MSDEAGSDETVGRPATSAFVLRLEAGTSESIAGWVGSPEGSALLRFDGWLDLMVAINALRASRTSQPNDRPLRDLT